MEIKNQVKDKNKVIAAAILIFSIMALCILAAIRLQSPKTTIRIERMDMVNPESAGRDVRVSGIYVDEKKLPARKVEFQGDWQKDDGTFITTAATGEAWLEFKLASNESLKIVFQNQEGSGYIAIKEAGTVLEEMDLYAAEFTQESFTRAGENLPFAAQMLPFVLLVIGLILETLLLQLFMQGLEEKISKKFANKRKCRFLNEFLMLAASILLYVCVEGINHNLGNVLILYSLLNVVLYFAMMLVLYLVRIPVMVSVAMVSAFAGVIGIANYYVTIFRGTPLSPVDLLVIETAKSVATNYQYEVPRSLTVFLMVWIAGFMLIKTLHKSLRTKKQPRNIVLYFVAAFLVVLICKGSIFNPLRNQWLVSQNVKTFGIGFNMVSALRQMYVKEPENYSKEEVEAIYESYAGEEQEEFAPNVIVIMNECFSDLSVIFPSLDSDMYMPYYNSLKENTVKGTAVVSVNGGLTSNSEFEFLTSNSLFYLKGAVPYQQYVLDNAFSLPGLMKNRGYQTTAIHPYYARGYNRIKVYEGFEFDQYLDMESFENPELVRDRYISDKDSYNKVIEIFEENQKEDAPSFIFNITMQNHSDYKSGYFGEDVITVPGAEGQYPEVEEYLTLIKKSDETFHVLIDYFSEVEEPTAILVFGDHQPAVNSELNTNVGEKYVAGEITAEEQKIFEVPFFVWTNYDIEEEEGIYTSLNYLSSIFFDRAGIALAPYQKYLLQLSERIPSINQTAYLGSDGRWHQDSTGTEDESYIEEYWKLEYYHMFENETIWKKYLN